MRVVAYLLANQCGELIAIPPIVDEAGGRFLLAQGWRVYRTITG